jgi:hypothetical protein
MNLQQLDLPVPTFLRSRLVQVAVGLALAASGCALSSDDDVQAERSSGGKQAQCFTTRLEGGGDVAEILPVDLRTEKLGAAVGTISSFDVSSLGAIDGKLVTCAYEGGIEIVDLSTNRSEQITRSCDGVTSDGTRIWVNSLYDRALYEYQGLQALRDNLVSRTLPGPYATRLGLGEGRLLAAWHSAAEVLAVDLETGATTPIAIPGYDGWIFGVAERDDDRYVVGGWVERGIRVYDRTSGELTNTLFADQFLQDLACTR